MRRLASLRRDTRGAAIVEFAIIAPVMMTLILGLCDLSYQIYAKSILNGAIQKTARDSAIQGGADNTAALDAKVTAAVQNIAKNATIVFTRKNYDSFSVIKPEPFVDTNGNGIRNAGECYTDINGNNQWDADPGVNGQGGANDVTLYTATVTYPRLFPLFGTTQTITASTLLKNQPYASQTTVTPTTVCT